jgi:pectate lyase
MNTKINIERLADWISELMYAAETDTTISVAKFEDTKNESFCITGGWMKGFSKEYADIFFISDSKPEYAMAVKITINDPECSSFEDLRMPTDRFGEVDNTCIPLELTDSPEAVAQIFAGEWERIVKESGEMQS